MSWDFRVSNYFKWLIRYWFGQKACLGFSVRCYGNSMRIKLLFLNLLRFFSNSDNGGGFWASALTYCFSRSFICISLLSVSLGSCDLCVSQMAGVWPQCSTTLPEALARLKNVVGQTHNEVASFSSRCFPLYFCPQVYRFIGSYFF